MPVKEYSYEWSKDIVKELRRNGWLIRISIIKAVCIDGVHTGVRVNGRIKSPELGGINYDVSFEVDRVIPSETKDVSSVTTGYLHNLFNEHAVNTIYQSDKVAVKPIIERIAPQWLK